jgi:outer membrane receptor protein involved in Fe transport
VAYQPAKATDPAGPPTDSPTASVVVTAKELPVQTLIDRKVYSLTNDVQASFGTLGDVLNAIPSVDVDPDGVLSLRGDSNVLVLIDGKPSPLFSGSKAADNLQSIPAKDIERIEVLTTPPPQFKADGAAGVINIITRKKRPHGVSGSMQGSLGSAGRSAVGADTSYVFGPLSFSVNAGFRNDERERVLASHVRSPLTPPDQVLDSQSILNEEIHRQVPSAGARAEYALSEQQSVSGSFNWLKRGGLRTYTQLDDSATPSGTVTSSTERLSAGHDPERDYDARLGFSSKLDRPGEELAISLHHATSHQREHYDYTNESFVPGAPTYDSYLSFQEDHAASELDADYTLPLAKEHTLKLGYSFERDDYGLGTVGGDTVGGIESVDPTLTDDFKFRQRINAGYGSYQAAAGLWNVLAGLRLELAQTDAQLLTDATKVSGHYFGVYPSLHVDRLLSDETTLSLGASRRVTRPDPSNLDPYVDHEYTPNLRSGNDQLQPEYTQSYELACGFQGHRLSYQVTAYYRRNRDSVTDVTRYQGNGFSLTTKANLPRDNSAGLEVTANGHLGSQLSYSLSANLFHSQIDATALGVPGLQSTNGVNGKLKLDYRPTPADSAQVAVTRTDKRLTPQGYVTAIDIVNAGYKHQLRSNLTALATVSDLFNGQRNERIENTPTFAGDYVRTIRGRVFFVGLIYSFGSAKDSSQPSFDYDQSG